MATGRSPYNASDILERVKKAPDKKTEINYVSGSPGKIDTIVYSSVQLGYIVTETFTYDGENKLTIERISA